MPPRPLAADATRARRTAKGRPSTDGIADRIAQAITQQRLAPGTRLVEENLGEIFGVSRTKIRQALIQLAATKVVTLAPGRGAIVAQPSVKEAREVFEARRAIEGALVRRFIDVAGAVQIDMLKEHLRLEKDALGRDAVTDRNTLLGDFHLLIARAAGNDVLTEILSELVSRSSLISLFYQSGHAASCSSDEHHALVEAIERRDGDAAARIMIEHISHVEQGLALKEEVPRTADLRAALSGM